MPAPLDLLIASPGDRLGDLTSQIGRNHQVVGERSLIVAVRATLDKGRHIMRTGQPAEDG